MKTVRLPNGDEIEDRRMNGSSKLIWTLALSASGVVFIGAMAWMTSLNGKVEALTLADTKREGQYSALFQGMKDSERRLSRIEEKLDQLLVKR